MASETNSGLAGSYKYYLYLAAEKGGRSFGLIQPTLIQQLKKILDEYPDDGQILKVYKPQWLFDYDYTVTNCSRV